MPIEIDVVRSNNTVALTVQKGVAAVGQSALGDVIVTGTPDAGDVLTATSDDTAEWAEPTGGGHVVEDETTALTARSKLSFQGLGVTATDNAGQDRTIVTIPGSVNVRDSSEAENIQATTLWMTGSTSLVGHGGGVVEVFVPFTPVGPEGEPGPNVITTATETDINGLITGNGTNVVALPAADLPISTLTQASLNLKAPLASPALTGNPTAPNQSPGDASTKLATTAFVSDAISTLIDGAPSGQNTLNELSVAKANLASPTFTGLVTTPALKITGSSPGSGKVWTSDADGDGTWETPAAGVTDHTLLSNIGTNTHAQIDTHLASTANPHSVTASQVGLPNVENAAASTLYVPLTRTVNGSALSSDVTITNITGNAATVTTNANLTGHITSTGNAAVLGSFTLAQLSTAVSDANVARTDAAQTFTGAQTFAGQVLATDGTASVPGLSFSGAAAVGFRRVATSLIVFCSSSADIWSSGASRITMRDNGLYCWSGSSDPTAGADLILSREGAAVLRLGTNDAPTINQTFKACDRITSDGVGANLTIAGGRNRGASAGGSIIFQTAPAAAATVTGTLATAMTIDSTGALTMHRLPSSVTPANNGELMFEATSNTSFTIKYKGSDGTVRSVALTLA